MPFLLNILMLEYILAVSLNLPCCDTYIGTFQNCEQAQSYYTKLLYEYEGYSCLHKDHIMLPEDFAHRYILFTDKIEVSK